MKYCNGCPMEKHCNEKNNCRCIIERLIDENNS